MKPVVASEIMHIADYEIARPALRERIIAMKEHRRIGVGDHVTLLFENHETVRYQIQEMMRIERIVRPDAIQHEIDTFNELLPATSELSATLLVEYPTPAERDVKLRELLGLEHHVWIEVTGAERTAARFDDRQIATDRISSVQYIRFPLTPGQVANWCRGAKLIVDHPAYRFEHSLTPTQLSALATDLQ